MTADSDCSFVSVRALIKLEKQADYEEDAMSEAQLAEYHRNVKSLIQQTVEELPLHQDFLDVVNSSS